MLRMNNRSAFNSRPPFKLYATMRKRYDDFILLNTNDTNEKLPRFFIVSQWIMESWEAISETQIKESMKQCGVTLKADGSEDKLLHCFNVKRNEDGFRLLQQRRCEGGQTCCDLDISDDGESEDSVCDSDESN